MVTKESTYLLKDIYKEVQTTLKKYDEIVRENQINRQKNNKLSTTSGTRQSKKTLPVTESVKTGESSSRDSIKAPSAVTETK